jgi:hypothetical protein
MVVKNGAGAHFYWYMTYADQLLLTVAA